jgi:hypothetical protein
MSGLARRDEHEGREQERGADRSKSDHRRQISAPGKRRVNCRRGPGASSSLSSRRYATSNVRADQFSWLDRAKRTELLRGISELSQPTYSAPASQPRAAGRYIPEWIANRSAVPTHLVGPSVLILTLLPAVGTDERAKPATQLGSELFSHDGCPLPRSDHGVRSLTRRLSSECCAVVRAGDT